MDEIDHLNAIMEIARKAAIEECARVADDYLQDYGPVGLVEAIRALKDKL